jgi:hypothetical protein
VRTLNLKLNLEGIDLGKDDKRTGPEVTMAMIENIVLAFANQKQRGGLTEQERRLFYKISDVFEKARVDKSETVELDDDWLGFIRKCFRESTLMPNRLLQRLEDELAKAGN